MMNFPPSHCDEVKDNIETCGDDFCGRQHQAQLHSRCRHPSGIFTRFNRRVLTQSLVERFEQQVNQNLDRLALSCRSERLTYSDLNQASNRLARSIIDRCGAQTENIMLLFAQSVASIVAVLAALKAAKCYVPVDPNSRRTHLAEVWRDSRSTLLVTDRRHLDLARTLGASEGQILNIDDINHTSHTANPGLPITPDSPAYIFYTSGSTGHPKGVIDTHRNVLHNVLRYTNSLRICSEDRLSLLYGPGSSASVSDTFGALLNGAGLCALDLRQVATGELASWLIRERVSIYHSVPSVFRHVLGVEDRLPDLRVIRLEGDRASPADIKRYQKQFEGDCFLVNGLGATECGLVSQYFFDVQTPVLEAVPIGYAVEDIELLVVNQQGDPVGEGQVGEIIVRSSYLADGYWNQPTLTDATFLPDPDGGSTRLYRTRDLARTGADGCLTHLGRCDSTVKLRGYGVDLVEIEAKLLEHSQVKDAVVVATEDDDPRLIAYVVGHHPIPVDIANLRAELAAQMPAHMVPGVYISVDRLSYTPAGKVDRRALPAPDQVRPELETPFVAPRDAWEVKLVNVWEKVLGRDSIGVRDDFFELGGHSLLVLRLAHQIGKVSGKTFSVEAVFQAPTVEQMAEILREEDSSRD